MKKAASLIFSEELPGILKYAVVLLMLSTVMRSPTLFLYNFNPDEATYTVISREMLDGALYYRDAVDTKPPGILHIYSAIFAVAGLYNRIALYCTLFVMVALTGLLLSFIGKRLWNLRTGRVAGLLYVVVGAFGNPSDFQTANCELFMNLPTVAAFFLYLRTRQRGGTWGYFGAGLLLSGAALIKFQAGFTAAAIALHLMTSPGPMLLPLLLGLGGLFLPFGSYAAYYYYMDAWDHMTWAILYNIFYVEALNLKLQLFNALKKTAVFIEFAFPLILPAAFFAMNGLKQRGRTNRTTYLLLIAWFLSAAVAVSMGGRYFHHYYIQLMPPLALMAACQLLVWVEIKPYLRLVITGIILVAAISWIAVAFLDKSIRPRKAWHQERYQAVGDYVRKHTRLTDRIFVWGDSPEIYMYAQRKPGTRYLWVNYQLGRIWGTPYRQINAQPPPPHLIAGETWSLLLDDLRRNRPVLVIDAAAGNLDKYDGHPIQRYPKIAGIVSRDYRLETTVLGVSIYRRKAGK